jgi:hypothetical protein
MSIGLLCQSKNELPGIQFKVSIIILIFSRRGMAKTSSEKYR